LRSRPALLAALAIGLLLLAGLIRIRVALLMLGILPRALPWIGIVALLRIALMLRVLWILVLLTHVVLQCSAGSRPT
jgi:hypothetical protein